MKAPLSPQPPEPPESPDTSGRALAPERVRRRWHWRLRAHAPDSADAAVFAVSAAVPARPRAPTLAWLLLLPFGGLLIIALFSRTDMVRDVPSEVVSGAPFAAIRLQKAESVDALFVHAGQRVEAGALLLTATRDKAQSELSPLLSEIALLEYETGQYRQFPAPLPVPAAAVLAWPFFVAPLPVASGAVQAFSVPLAEITSALFAGGGDLTELAAPALTQRRVAAAQALATRRQTWLARQQLCDAQYAESQAGARAAALDVRKLEARLPLFLAKADAMKTMLKSESISQMQYLEAEEARQELLSTIEMARERVSQHRALGERVMSAWRTFEADMRRENEALLTVAQQRLAAQRQKFLQLVADSEPRKITAPLAGRITDWRMPAKGPGVAGEPLMTIVPEAVPAAARLQVAAQVSGALAGQIRVGQKARVSVQAYPAARDGVLRAEVSEIATQAVRDAQRLPVYTVLLNVSALSESGTPISLKPGMRVRTDIVGNGVRLFDLLFQRDRAGMR